jgi:hypothetical protein
MEKYCSKSQSPHRAVAPTEERRRRTLPTFSCSINKINFLDSVHHLLLKESTNLCSFVYRLLFRKEPKVSGLCSLCHIQLSVRSFCILTTSLCSIQKTMFLGSVHLLTFHKEHDISRQCPLSHTKSNTKCMNNIHRLMFTTNTWCL